jgi:hypothetical protein
LVFPVPLLFGYSVLAEQVGHPVLARAILLVEKSMFERQRKKRRKDSDLTVEEGRERDEGDGEDDKAGRDREDDEEFEWRNRGVPTDCCRQALW